MKVFNVIMVILTVFGLAIFFFLFTEFRSTEVDLFANDQSGIGVAMVLISTLWAFFGSITLMLIDLVVILIVKKWNDRFSKVILLVTALAVLVEFIALAPLLVS